MHHQSYHELERSLHDTKATLQGAEMQLAILQHLSHLLHSTLDLNKILSVLLTLVTAGPALGFNRAILLLKNEENKELEGVLGVGPDNLEEAYEIWARLQNKSLEEIINECENIANNRDLDDIVNQLKVPLTQEGGILAIAVVEGKPFNVTADLIKSDVDKNIATILESDTLVIVPLKAKEEVIGIIIADNLFTQRPITSEDIQLLSIIANHAAVAVENARLYQRSEKQLKRMEQMQDRLLLMERHMASGEMSSVIAHEIKNPLIAIGGFAKRLHRKMAPVDPNWETMGIIVEEVNRLERLLKQLQSFSPTVEHGEENCDVNLIIQKILTLLKGELEVLNIKLEANFADGLPKVLISEDEIKQVFLNLIQNAIQAMPNGGHLKIDGFYDQDAIMIQVKDNGTGIPSNIQENIFQPLFTTKEEGSGLGLALSSQIIKAHGGLIKIEESEPNNGTTFSICLPV
ncbi:GAF domain-containing protein [bacterium]|nr:GAF domain-containing protein [bacterium]